MKGTFRLDTIARGKTDDKPYVALSGLYKPTIGAEQHAELILSDEDWQKIITNVGWQQVQEAVHLLREDLNKPKRQRERYVCPSCGELRDGHEKPDNNRTAADQKALEANQCFHKIVPGNRNCTECGQDMGHDFKVELITVKHVHAYDGTDPLCTICGDLKKEPERGEN